MGIKKSDRMNTNARDSDDIVPMIAKIAVVLMISEYNAKGQNVNQRNKNRAVHLV